MEKKKDKNQKEKKKVEGRTIGVDLGTTFSAVAVMEGGNAKIITNCEGERTTPSVVHIKDDEVVVGSVARNQAMVDPEHTVRSIKRKMGSDEKIKIKDKEYTPQEISAMILKKMKKDAEDYLGGEVKNAVITVPAYFNDSQRQATKDAGKIAGLNVLRIINEPTAASLAYGLEKSDEHTVLVFDFGGGTFDVSILELGDGVFEVKATSGNNHLGGDDIDEVLMDWLNDGFKKKNGLDLREDATAAQRLKEAAERAKIELSTKKKVEVSVPFIIADDKGPKHLKEEISRAKFEELIEEPILKKLEKPTKQAIEDAKLKAEDIDKVIFVGGSTRIPAVQAIVKEITGKEGDKSVNPDEAVALGAAIQAGVLTGDVKDVLLLDVTPLSLGIETLGGVFTKLIERNTTIPTKKSKVFSTATDNQTAVTIRVAQGERPMFADNKVLGQFDLVGIPPAPRGVPQVEVTFDIDANGILNVSAKDKGTGKEQEIKITGTGNLSDDEIGEMQEEAKKHEEEDKKKKEKIETENQADALLHQSKKLMEEFKDKADKETKENIEKIRTELGEAKEKGDIQKMKKKIEELNNAVQQIGAKIYQEAAQAQGAREKAKEKAKKKSKDEEEVVDADYKEEKKEDKKEKKKKD